MDTDPRDAVADQLPLTPLSFHILLALAGGDAHGYGILKEIEAQTAGAMAPATGALYLAAQRLVDGGLIREADPRPDMDGGDRRRKYYTLTPFGRAVAEGEAERLVNLVGIALRKGLVQGQLTLARPDA